MPGTSRAGGAADPGAVRVERVSRVTDELAGAVGRLLGQLHGGGFVDDRPLLEAVAADPANRLLVARDATTAAVVGTATVVLVTSLRGPHARIEDVVVDEHARGRGVGAALTRAALEAAESAGATLAELTSRPSRAAAQRLYQRVGFELVETNVYRRRLPRHQSPSQS